MPTTAELGMPDIDATSWFGLFAPPRLPPELAARIASDVAIVVEQPLVKQRIGETGADTATMPPPEFARFVAAENQKWSRVVRNLKIPLQD